MENLVIDCHAIGVLLESTQEMDADRSHPLTKVNAMQARCTGQLETQDKPILMGQANLASKVMPDRPLSERANLTSVLP